MIALNLKEDLTARTIGAYNAVATMRATMYATLYATLLQRCCNDLCNAVCEKRLQIVSKVNKNIFKPIAEIKNFSRCQKNVLKFKTTFKKVLKS